MFLFFIVSESLCALAVASILIRGWWPQKKKKGDAQLGSWDLSDFSYVLSPPDLSYNGKSWNSVLKTLQTLPEVVGANPHAYLKGAPTSLTIDDMAPRARPISELTEGALLDNLFNQHRIAQLVNYDSKHPEGCGLPGCGQCKTVYRGLQRTYGAYDEAIDTGKIPM